VIMEEGARISFVHDSDDSARTKSYRAFFLASNATFDYCGIQKNNHDTFLWIEYYMRGSNCTINHTTFLHGKQRDSHALITKQFHEASNCTSSLLVKSLLQESSRMFYRGIIDIEKEAEKTQADQKHV